MRKNNSQLHSWESYTCRIFFLYCKFHFVSSPGFCLKRLEISDLPLKDTMKWRATGQMLLTASKVKDFLEGKLKILPVGDLDISELTDFERKVLCELRRNVSFGKTASYSELAKFAGSPGASRAVGNVMNKNPFPLFFPCHRIINADGSLGGFGAGTGLKIKLLENEKKSL